MYQKSIKHVSYDSLRPNERAGTKKFCKNFLSYIDPFDNCAIMVPFCGMDHQKSDLLLISDTHSARGCWGQPMLLFWKSEEKKQMGKPRDHAVRDTSPKFSVFLPLRAILKNPYHYETPCKWYEISCLCFKLQGVWTQNLMFWTLIRPSKMHQNECQAKHKQGEGLFSNFLKQTPRLNKQASKLTS